jgi:phage protein D
MQSVNLSKYAPEFEIMINDEVNSIVRHSTVSVQVNEEIGKTTDFTLILADYFDSSKQAFVWLDSPLFSPGQKITIKMGYANNLEKIVEGKIKTVSTSGFSGEIPKLTIQGFHIGHNNFTEESSGDEPIKLEQKDTYSKIAEKLADKSGLKKVIDPTEAYSPVIAKKPIVYSEFLKDAAKRVGFEFFIARDTLYFFNPRKERGDGPNLKFEWGNNLIQFNPIINTANLVTKVEVRGHQSHSKTGIIGVAGPGSEDIVEEGKMTASQLAAEIYGEKKLDIKDRVVASKKEADDMAKAELNAVGDNLITASGSIIGTSNLVPGLYLILDRIGQRFSGKYFVTKVTQTIDGNGYMTTFNVRRNVIGKVRK